ncbi:MAG: hypothetical protein HQK72_14485 [Desulfamplus sp.]|nr:hypothetical protein [Desulfamplus sp.]
MKNSKKFEINRLLQGFSPFIIFGVAIILVPIFVLMTMDNIREQNGRTIEKLTGKGIFLIRAFEAGTRTGMLTMSWSVAKVQSLLTETALQPEVEYMMITDIDGTILAHSDSSKVGEKYENMPDIKVLKSEPNRLNSKKAKAGSKEIASSGTNFDNLIWHRELPTENNHKMFQVFKWFTPAHRRFRAGKPPIPFCSMVDGKIDCPADSKGGCLNSELQLHLRDMDWFKIHFLSPKHGKLPTENHQNQIIFAALDMSEVEIAKAKYLRHVIAMGFMFFVLGCTGVVGIIAFQGYRSARTSISELKGEIERSRRLAAVGKLAAGVAHEIRNPLSSIKGFATYFKERYSNVQEDIEVADIMIQEVERLNRAVTQLLEFAKPLPIMTKEINIKELIAHSIKLIDYEKNQKNISVKVDYHLNRESIITDPDRLNQILLNLYLNALQAMEDNGQLTIRIYDMYCKKIYDDNVHKAYFGDLKDKILIEITDTGKGIDEKDMEHIFDPYFTTRPEGSGLGLAMVHKTVEALGGDIKVDSKQGKGTTFFIRLPYLYSSRS